MRMKSRFDTFWELGNLDGKDKSTCIACVNKRFCSGNLICLSLSTYLPLFLELRGHTYL